MSGNHLLALAIVALALETGCVTNYGGYQQGTQGFGVQGGNDPNTYGDDEIAVEPALLEYLAAYPEANIATRYEHIANWEGKPPSGRPEADAQAEYYQRLGDAKRLWPEEFQKAGTDKKKLAALAARAGVRRFGLAMSECLYDKGYARLYWGNAADDDSPDLAWGFNGLTIYVKDEPQTATIVAYAKRGPVFRAVYFQFDISGLKDAVKKDDDKDWDELKTEVGKLTYETVAKKIKYLGEKVEE